MLQAIRDRSGGWLFGIIIVILCIPFALFGVNSYFSPEVIDYVAKVNDVEIAETEFNREMTAERNQRRAQLGENFDPRTVNNPEFRRQLVERMIQREVLLQQSREAGLTVSPTALAREISSIPAFQREGQFNRELYAALLQQQRITADDFEDLMTRDMIISQFPNTITQSAFVPPALLKRYAELENQQRRFDYVTVPASKFRDAINLTDEEIQTYFDENAEQYRTDEKVSIRYFVLDAANMAESVEIDEDTLRLYFEDRKDFYRSPEQRQASHILLEMPAEANAVERQEIMDKAADLVEQARAGADFAELAKEHSTDPGSADFGGDLGWVAPGDMVQAFEDALFDLPEVGAVSEPVETGFGIHVIKITDIQEAGGQEFADVRDEILAEIRKTEAERLFIEQSDRALDLVYELENDIAKVAAEMDVELQTSDSFTRLGGTGIAAEAAIVDAAFSELVLYENEISDPITVGENQAAFIQVLEHTEPGIPDLADVRTQVEQALRNQRAQQQAADLADAIAAAVRSETAFADVASEHELELKQTELVGRRGSGLPYGLMQEVFALPENTEDPVHVVDANATDKAVVYMHEVQLGDWADVPESEQESLRTRLSRTYAMEANNRFVELLRDQSEVKIIEDRIE